MPPIPGDERLDKVEGRYRISRHGLEEARHRWHTGDYGPTSEFAEKAALHCRSCAFYLKVEGAIGENFGVCANEYSADGHLVHATYGCGAHSETPPTPSQGEEPPSAFDDELPVDY